MALIRSAKIGEAAAEAVVLDLGDLQRQGEQLKRRAEEEAARIVEEARRRADQLTAGAEERGYETGLAKGRAEGLEAGRRDGHAEALEQSAQSLQRLEQAWISAARQWDADRRRMLQEARRSLLKLAVAMAEKIIRRVPAADPSIVVDQVAAAIEHVARPCDATIRVHPDDRPLVEQAMPGLAGDLGRLGHVTLSDDERVERGGCIVTCGQGRIDATLETQLRRLVDALLPQDGGGDPEPSGDAPTPPTAPGSDGA